MSDQKQQQAQEILLKSLGFEDSLAYLKSAGVYDHVAAVLMKLSLEKPSNALDVFENYSATVKSAKVAFPSTHDSQKLNEAHIKLQKTMLPALNKSQQLIQQSHAVQQFSDCSILFPICMQCSCSLHFLFSGC
jgi:hypothetical protein